jgi:hypothetical protein
VVCAIHSHVCAKVYVFVSQSFTCVLEKDLFPITEMNCKNEREESLLTGSYALLNAFMAGSINTKKGKTGL